VDINELLRTSGPISHDDAGRLIDVKSKKVLSEQTIVVEGDRILSVNSGYQMPAKEDKLVDLKNSTVMPGLMDMHVHIENQTSPTRFVDGFRDNEADVAYKALPYAHITLMSGFTTVRDL
jgi:imidazolonepropionase-like amidohydrolase